MGPVSKVNVVLGEIIVLNTPARQCSLIGVRNVILLRYHELLSPDRIPHDSSLQSDECVEFIYVISVHVHDISTALKGDYISNEPLGGIYGHRVDILHIGEVVDNLRLSVLILVVVDTKGGALALHLPDTTNAEYLLDFGSSGTFDESV